MQSPCFLVQAHPGWDSPDLLTLKAGPWIALLGSSQASATDQAPTTAFSISVNRKSLLSVVWVNILELFVTLHSHSTSDASAHLISSTSMCSIGLLFPTQVCASITSCAGHGSRLLTGYLFCLDHCSGLLTVVPAL